MSTAWRDEKSFRLFVSHISSYKDQVHSLCVALQPYSIAAFAAHDDIEPGAEWQGVIEDALRTMDAMLLFVVDGYASSPWTQQEAGFALGRDAKILSFKFDGKENPQGFMASVQALSRRSRTSPQVALAINNALLAAPETADRLKAAQAQ